MHTAWATSPLSSLLDDQQPVQQFVTSEPDPPPATVTADTNTAPASTTPAPAATVAPANPPSAPLPTTPIPLQPASTMVPPPPPPAISSSPASTPATARALGLSSDNSAPTTDNGLSGGLDENILLRCQHLVTGMCSKTKDSAQFQTCLMRLKDQPLCGQFLSFAKATQLGVHDDIDLIKQYPQANLALIHVTYFGANYPGVYYALGTNGNLVDLIFGPQMQTVDISKDVNFPAIIARFPKVQLFSIVDQLPQTQTSPNDRGLRLILRFQLLDGCHACARAGYANVAYDFSESGELQQISVASLEPAP